MSDGGGGDLGRRGVDEGVTSDVALNGDGERWQLRVADHASELALGFEHPGGGPAQAHVSVLPTLDVAARALDGVDHRLARVRRGQRLLQRAAHSQAGDGERLLQALAERRRGAWMAAVEFGDQAAEALKCRGMVV